MAHGSFYTYFASRQDVFVAVMREVGEQFRMAVAVPPGEPRTAVLAALDRANRRYLEAYRANSVIWALAEQVATMDEEIHRIRLRGRIEHVERVAKTIRRWQDHGLADRDIDPRTTAGALVSMLSNFAYWWLAGGDSYDPETAAVTLTAIWARAVGFGRTVRATSGTLSTTRFVGHYQLTACHPLPGTLLLVDIDVDYDAVMPETRKTFGDVSVWPSGDLVATVEIGRPPDNFFDVELIISLADACAWLDEQPEFRAAVLCSDGKHFCAGADFTGRSGRTGTGGAKELYAAGGPAVRGADAGGRRRAGRGGGRRAGAGLRRRLPRRQPAGQVLRELRPARPAPWLRADGHAARDRRRAARAGPAVHRPPGRRRGGGQDRAGRPAGGARRPARRPRRSWPPRSPSAPRSRCGRSGRRCAGRWRTGPGRRWTGNWRSRTGCGRRRTSPRASARPRERRPPRFEAPVTTWPFRIAAGVLAELRAVDRGQLGSGAEPGAMARVAGRRGVGLPGLAARLVRAVAAGRPGRAGAGGAGRCGRARPGRRGRRGPGRRRCSSSTAPMRSGNGSSGVPSPARSPGASCSASQLRARTWPG